MSPEGLRCACTLTAHERANLHNLFSMPYLLPAPQPLGTHTHLTSWRRGGAGAVCALMLSATTACTEDRRPEALADSKRWEHWAFPAVEAVAADSHDRSEFHGSAAVVLRRKGFA